MRDGVSGRVEAVRTYSERTLTRSRFLSGFLPREVVRVGPRFQRPGGLHEELLGSVGFVQGYVVMLGIERRPDRTC